MKTIKLNDKLLHLNNKILNIDDYSVNYPTSIDMDYYKTYDIDESIYTPAIVYRDKLVVSSIANTYLFDISGSKIELLDSVSTGTQVKFRDPIIDPTGSYYFCSGNDKIYQMSITGNSINIVDEYDYSGTIYDGGKTYNDLGYFKINKNHLFLNSSGPVSPGRALQKLSYSSNGMVLSDYLEFDNLPITRDFVLDGDIIYFGAGFKSDTSSVHAKLYKIDITDMSVIDTSIQFSYIIWNGIDMDDNYIYTTMTMTLSDPASSIYKFSKSSMNAIDWLDNEENENINTSPTLTSTKIYYADNVGQMFSKRKSDFHPITEVIDSTPTDSIAFKPKIIGDYLYIGSNDNKVYKYDLNLNVVGSVETDGNIKFPSTNIQITNNNYLYVVSGDKKVYKIGTGKFKN